MDYKRHRIEVAREHLKIVEQEKFEWTEVIKLKESLCCECYKFLDFLESHTFSDDEIDYLFMELGRSLNKEIDEIPDSKDVKIVDFEDSSSDFKETLRNNVKCLGYTIEKTRLMILISKVYNGIGDKIICNRILSKAKKVDEALKNMPDKMADVLKECEDEYSEKLNRLKDLYQYIKSENESDETAEENLYVPKRKILKEIWLNAKEECIRIYGKKAYENEYRQAIKQELKDLSKYTNGPEVVYTLMLIHHEIMRKMGCYKDAKTDYMLNGSSAYVRGRFGQSVVLFLLGLTGYNRIEGNKSSPFDWGSFVFSTDSSCESGEKEKELYITLAVSDDYYEAIKKQLVSNGAWINRDEEHTASKYLHDWESRRIVCNIVFSEDQYRQEKDSNKTNTIFENNEERWIGKNIILYKDKSLNFLSELEKSTKIPFTEIGYPDQYEVLVPMSFDFPHGVNSKPVKWMFWEDLYEIFSNYTDMLSRDIYRLIEQLRRKKIDTELHERINAAGITDEDLALISKIGYFPLRGGISNEFFTAWRIEQFRKKNPASYYYVLLKMLREDRLTN